MKGKKDLANSGVRERVPWAEGKVYSNVLVQERAWSFDELNEGFYERSSYKLLP